MVRTTILRAGLSAASPAHRGEQVDMPTPAQVAEMLARVDGVAHDQLVVRVKTYDGPRPRMQLSGGSDGLVTCFWFLDPDTFYVQRPLRTVGSDGDDVADISSGGSGLEVPVRWLVGLDTAARALWYFLLSGERDPGMRWEHAGQG